MSAPYIGNAWLGLAVVSSLCLQCGGTEYSRVDIRARGDLEELCVTDTVDLDLRLYALDDDGRETLVTEVDPALVPAWSSDAESIASVDADGVVTMNAVGVATITLALDVPAETNTKSIQVSVCDCLEPVTDPTRLFESIVTAPPVQPAAFA